MKFDNYMILDIPSKSANEGFARAAVACFASQLDPTLEEIGDKFGLTRERVRQIKEKAIRRLKQNSRSKLLKSYLG